MSPTWPTDKPVLRAEVRLRHLLPLSLTLERPWPKAFRGIPARLGPRRNHLTDPLDKHPPSLANYTGARLHLWISAKVCKKALVVGNHPVLSQGIKRGGAACRGTVTVDDLMTGFSPAWPSVENG